MSQSLTIPTSLLGFDYNIELESWSNSLHAFKIFDGKPKEVLDGGIGLGFNLITQFSEGQNWLKGIPQPLLAATTAFPEHQYQMLWLAANTDQAAQLLLTRPLLLVLICEKYPVDNNAALKMSQLGQRDILKSLGYDGSKSALKFIDKLTLTFERDLELQHVKKQLDSRFCGYKVFNHYSSVNYVALSLDHRYSFLTGTKLGRAIACEKGLTRVSLLSCLADTLMLGVELGVNDPASRVGQLSSLNELNLLHQEWIDRRNDIRRQELRPMDADTPYPCMLLGNEQIVAIKNYDELFNEGVNQRHCIAIYHSRIVAGEYCVFMMEQPQRVTIGLKIHNRQTISIELDQIAGLRNALPTDETRKVVYRWFESAKRNLISD
ncbi:PcfJ domain-containing protein [uncultured Shewanella sp.]|uniref:PcfJ domain-containing protein n=1 Tax=uncultured Shewanella sp. TaxID=173975 RepID=UPI00261D665A|nr:PcfJ domain-containing protein [uncultured Shewanella sp.]